MEVLVQMALVLVEHMASWVGNAKCTLVLERVQDQRKVCSWLLVVVVG